MSRVYKWMICLLALHFSVTVFCQVVEAENFIKSSGCTVNTQHTGYSGLGYIDYKMSDAWVQWEIASTSQTKYINFIFSNGSSESRKCQILINGQNTTTIAFPSTGSWSAWGEKGLLISLQDGINTITLVARESGPNIDRLEISERYSGSWAQVPNILKKIKKPTFVDNNFPITDFGAIGDGKTDCYLAIKKAVAVCNAAGGGKVIIPSGTFLVNGPIHLQSNVNLHLEKKDSQIIFGTEHSDYLVGEDKYKGCVLTSWEGTQIYNYSPMVYAHGKENIAITGLGTIDGQGKAWWSWRYIQWEDQQTTREMNNNATPIEQRIFGSEHFLRPAFIQFFSCKNILVEGVTLKDGPFWMVHPVFCSHVTVRDIKFNSLNLNNDGIDPEQTSYVHIANIDFNNGDDNIAIKAGRDREGRELGVATEYVIVQNCRFKAYNGICIGSEMSGSVHNVFVEDCSYGGDVRSAVYLKSNRSRGGEISNVFVRNLEFDHCNGHAIYFNTNYKQQTGSQQPFFYNITIENLFCRSVSWDAIYIKGLPEKHLKHISLRNIFIGSAYKAKSVKNVEQIAFENVWINGKKQQIQEK